MTNKFFVVVRTAGCEFDADEITSTLNRTFYDFQEEVEWVVLTIILFFLFYRFCLLYAKTHLFEMVFVFSYIKFDWRWD